METPVKILNKFLTALLIAVIFIACDSKEKPTNPVESRVSDSEADVRTVQLDIDGMTCEIGCAKLIQSKLYKTEGVSFAEVHFADSSGVVSYDANRLSEKEIINAVEQAGYFFQQIHMM